MARSKRPLHPDAPLYHRDHSRPVTRRDFLRQGLVSGLGAVMGGSVLSLFANPRAAWAALSSDLTQMAGNIGCALGGVGGGKIPFICFDLAGGANIAGSNVLVGKQNGQLDLLTTAGYRMLGLPGDMIPGLTEATPTATSNGNFTDTTLGLGFHSDSAMLRGILEKAVTALGNVNGCIIPARSENDTGSNPHNPMYGIARAGGTGTVVTLIGSSNSESGGNSVSPPTLVNPEIRPTKVDRPSDVTGMVDTGNLTGILNDPADVVAVMESVVRLSDAKLKRVDTRLAGSPNIGADLVVKDLVRCGYLKSADLADRFAGVNIDPSADPAIVNDATGIFTSAEFNGDSEFRKTASVMKMVVDGYAGAGTISMGGYDYHTGDRSTGELRDLRAGRCMGACLEYAARRGVPLMLYVFSDGSLFSNGTVDNSANGRGKGVWTGDNQSTAASFFLVYNPGGVPVLLGGTPEEQARHQQIGWFRPDGSVETSSSYAANNVNLLVQLVVLNYMQLNGDRNNFASLFNGFGANPSAALLDSMTAFAPL